MNLLFLLLVLGIPYNCLIIIPPSKADIALADSKRNNQTIRNSTKASKVLNIPISPEHGLELYQHWLNQAFSNLISALAHQRLKTQPSSVRKIFGICSKKAAEVQQHAKCLSLLIRGKMNPRNSTDHVIGRTNELLTPLVTQKAKKTPISKQQRLEKYLGIKKNYFSRVPARRKIIKFHKIHAIYPVIKIVRDQDATNMNRKPDVRNSRPRWLSRLYSPTVFNSKRRRKFDNITKIFPKFRPKRNTSPSVTSKFAKRDNSVRTPPLLNRYEGITPIGGIAKLLSKMLISTKNKTQIAPWQNVIEQISQIKAKHSGSDRLKDSSESQLSSKEVMEEAAFRGIPPERSAEMEDLVERMKLKRMLKSKRKERSKHGTIREKVADLMRDGFKLGYGLAGKNMSHFDDKNLKMASPRFLSVVPEDKTETIDILSPSLLSFHKQGKGLEGLLSLPNLMNGFSDRDQQEWMNLIMEASGANEQVGRLIQTADVKQRTLRHISREQYEKEIRGSEGQPLYFTRENVTEMFGSFEDRKISTWKALEKSFTNQQWHEMNETGYTTMTASQITFVYGPDSPYNDSDTLSRLCSFSHEKIHTAIIDDIHRTAEMESFKIRQKDVVLSPVVLNPIVSNPALVSQPIVLSPLVLSPVILSPSVLGPVILSPWLFVPLILSPRVLSPLILSPFPFSPVILTPIALHPLILSPGIFDPIILSPFLLAPVILSPLAFAPLILNPLALSPLILNPMLASPLILSPFVLSPIIASPQVLSALILSPYALSPVIASPLIAFSVILSPSWLS